MRVLSYDVETNKTGKMCQLGMILWDTETKESETYTTYVKTIGPMGYSQQIHGITKEQAMSGIHPNEAINTLWKWCKRADIVVAHNYTSEYCCLSRHLTREPDLRRFLAKGVFCTWRFAKKYYPKLPDKSVSGLWETLEIGEDPPGKVHDALVDAIMTKRIFEYFLEEHGEEVLRANYIIPIPVPGARKSLEKRVLGVSITKKYPPICPPSN